jgi:hypothetical protein
MNARNARKITVPPLVQSALHAECGYTLYSTWSTVIKLNDLLSEGVQKFSAEGFNEPVALLYKTQFLFKEGKNLYWHQDGEFVPAPQNYQHLVKVLKVLPILTEDFFCPLFLLEYMYAHLEDFAKTGIFLMKGVPDEHVKYDVENGKQPCYNPDRNDIVVLCRKFIPHSNSDEMVAARKVQVEALKQTVAAQLAIQVAYVAAKAQRKAQRAAKAPQQQQQQRRAAPARQPLDLSMFITESKPRRDRKSKPQPKPQPQQ